MYEYPLKSYLQQFVELRSQQVGFRQVEQFHQVVFAFSAMQGFQWQNYIENKILAAKFSCVMNMQYIKL